MFNHTFGERRIVGSGWPTLASELRLLDSFTMRSKVDRVSQKKMQWDKLLELPGSIKRLDIYDSRRFELPWETMMMIFPQLTHLTVERAESPVDGSFVSILSLSELQCVKLKLSYPHLDRVLAVLPAGLTELSYELLEGSGGLMAGDRTITVPPQLVRLVLKGFSTSPTPR